MISWPYGIREELFAPPPPARAPQLRLGFIGTLMVSKGPDVLLEAFARLPPGRAALDLHGAPADYHGDASFRERLAPLLQTPGARTLGSRPHAEIPQAFKAMDVLVVPSVWPENSPIVIREALLSGVPVVGLASAAYRSWCRTDGMACSSNRATSPASSACCAPYSTSRVYWRRCARVPGPRRFARSPTTRARPMRSTSHWSGQSLDRMRPDRVPVARRSHRAWPPSSSITGHRTTPGWRCRRSSAHGARPTACSSWTTTTPTRGGPARPRGATGSCICIPGPTWGSPAA
jgi:hypothetical protein